ncbi:MAG: hypothetical protein R3F31_18975 [Verrucomicrobiales bacterium]
MEVADFTGFPEMFEGRIKTLHPKIHGGILFRRDAKEHVKQAQKHDIKRIDLVVVNLYPFEETVAKAGVTLDEAIEQIDIGGPAMLRSSAKNHASVAVVVDPADYATVIGEMNDSGGGTTLGTRERLAIKVFQHTSTYDRAIAGHSMTADDGTSFRFLPEQDLRMGKSSSTAALVRSFHGTFKQIQGKALSYTNARYCGCGRVDPAEFRRPAVAILKHTNPCGVGAATTTFALPGESLRDGPARPYSVGSSFAADPHETSVWCTGDWEIFTDVIIAP